MHALRRVVPAIVALVVAAAATVTVTGPAEAAYKPRVVIVVGPSGSATRDYLSHAHAYARKARALGARVSEVYTPNATWARVLQAAQGANVFIYLGHGNGWPSPYAPWQNRTKNGLGLNPSAGSGNMRVKYYGEAAVQASIRLAPGAIVLLNRLCYASGSAEPGMAQPKWSTAVKRVDNYAAGFLRTGAGAVIADGHTSLAYELPALFGGDQLITRLWTRDPDANGNTRSFNSRRTGQARTHLDPDRAKTGFFRSLALLPGAHSAAIRDSRVLRVDAEPRAPAGGPGHGRRAHDPRRGVAGVRPPRHRDGRRRADVDAGHDAHRSHGLDRRLAPGLRRQRADSDRNGAPCEPVAPGRATGHRQGGRPRARARHPQGRRGARLAQGTHPGGTDRLDRRLAHASLTGALGRTRVALGAAGRRTPESPSGRWPHQRAHRGTYRAPWARPVASQRCPWDARGVGRPGRPIVRSLVRWTLIAGEGPRVRTAGEGPRVRTRGDGLAATDSKWPWSRAQGNGRQARPSRSATPPRAAPMATKTTLSSTG